MRHYKPVCYYSQLEESSLLSRSAHALAQLKNEEFKANDNVVIYLSGRGDKDLDTYIKHFGY